MNDLKWCISYLEKVNGISLDTTDLVDEDKLRALMNITMPINLSEEFYARQDRYLIARRSNLDIIDVNTLPLLDKKISLIKEDITKLKAEAITNACNEKLLGCFVPLHSCIDNAIHSYAGLEVRRDLYLVMKEQGHDEENGKCKVTNGYNLPSKYIFHTVGPKIIDNIVTKQDEDDLKNCYLSCLKEAEARGLKNIVFCSISTGVYGFPISKASKIAVRTVKEYLKNSNIERVIFDVYLQQDYEIYLKTIKNLN